MDGVAMEDSRCAKVIEEFLELREQHKALNLSLLPGEGLCVHGTLFFQTEINSVGIQDSFEIQISIPDKYPIVVPTVREVGGRIPAEYHQFKNGDLCLGAPVEVDRTFLRQPSLKGFVNRLLVGYLGTYVYYKKFAEMPSGELSHGAVGLVEYYQDFFECNIAIAIKFLKLLSDEKIDGFSPCPCGSSLNLAVCHGAKISELRSIRPAPYFESELRAFLREGAAAGIIIDDRSMIPHRTWVNRRRNSRVRKRKKRSSS